MAVVDSLAKFHGQFMEKYGPLEDVNGCVSQPISS